jgi:hypothetical protein
VASHYAQLLVTADALPGIPTPRRNSPYPTPGSLPASEFTVDGLDLEATGVLEQVGVLERRRDTVTAQLRPACTHPLPLPLS